jgi:predicted nucleic acid-binding protein
VTVFVDTNILLYAHGINAENEPQKVKIAERFIREN